MFDLVIFDCDGTLTESEILASRVESKLLEGYGVHLTPEEVTNLYSGVGGSNMCVDIKARFGVDLPSDFVDQVEQGIMSRADQELEAVKHAHEVLDTLAKEFCVASNSGPSWIEETLKSVDLWKFVSGKTYSAHQVDRSKPAPDLFLFAASQSSVDPGRCLVVEDSEAGVAGAVAAGMSVIGFHGAKHCTPARADALRDAGAHRLSNDLRHVLQWAEDGW